NVWEAAVAADFPVVLEYDSLAEANDPAAIPRLLTHPAGLTTSAGFIAVATDGSFASDGGAGGGTKIWLRPTGSGNPNTSGKVYEVTTTNNLIVVHCNHGQIGPSLILQNTMAVGTNNTGADASVGDTV